MTTPPSLNSQYAEATPFVKYGYAWFPGKNGNFVYSVQVTSPYGNKPGFPSNRACNGPVFVASGYVYFRDTSQGSIRKQDWQTGHDASGFNTDGSVQTLATPFVADETVYYIGIDNNLWAVDIDGTNNRLIYEPQGTASCMPVQPFVNDNYIFFGTMIDNISDTSYRLQAINRWTLKLSTFNATGVWKILFEDNSTIFVLNDVVYMTGVGGTFSHNYVWLAEFPSGDKVSDWSEKQWQADSGPFYYNGVVYFQGIDSNDMWGVTQSSKTPKFGSWGGVEGNTGMFVNYDTTTPPLVYFADTNNVLRQFSLDGVDQQ